MNEFIERLKEILTQEKVKRDQLSEMTGIKATRLNNVIAGNAQPRAEEIKAIGQAFPEYKLWLAYGEEMPEAGQISPGTKKARQDLNQTGVAG